MKWIALIIIALIIRHLIVYSDFAAPEDDEPMDPFSRYRRLQDERKNHETDL